MRRYYLFLALVGLVLLLPYNQSISHIPITASEQKTALLKAASADEDLQELIDFAPDLVNYEQVIKWYRAGPLDSGNTAEDVHGDGLVNEGEVVTVAVSHSYTDTPSPEPESSFTNILSPFPRGAPPNIILIISDDQTYESLGRMPYVGSLANYWSRFTNAYNNVSLCCPSRVAMLTGQFSHHNRVEDNLKAGLFNTQDNLVTSLHDSGYHTALIGKYLNGWKNLGPLATPPGWDHFAAFVTPDFYNYQIFEDGIVNSYGSEAADYSTDVVGQKAVDFITTAQEPFFLLFSPYAAHGPFIPAPRHEDANVGTFIKDESFNEADVSDKPQWIQELPTTQEARMEELRLIQYRQLLAVDEWVKKINDLLVQKGILKNTVIIYVSDNSLAFGEHRLIGKTCGYDICNHIPLLIRYPYNPGRTIRNLVSNVDITPTIAELAGIQLPGSDGISLVPLLKKPIDLKRKGLLIHWAGEEASPFYLTPAFWGIIEPDWKYMELATGEKELYDRLNDPLELNNVAGNPAYAAIQSQLQADLRAQLIRSVYLPIFYY